MNKEKEILINLWNDRLEELKKLMDCYNGLHQHDEYKGRYEELEKCIKELSIFTDEKTS